MARSTARSFRSQPYEKVACLFSHPLSQAPERPGRNLFGTKRPSIRRERSGVRRPFLGSKSANGRHLRRVGSFRNRLGAVESGGKRKETSRGYISRRLINARCDHCRRGSAVRSIARSPWTWGFPAAARCREARPVFFAHNMLRQAGAFRLRRDCFGEK